LHRRTRNEFPHRNTASHSFAISQVDHAINSHVGQEVLHAAEHIPGPVGAIATGIDNGAL
jgi:hypothetical protein